MNKDSVNPTTRFKRENVENLIYSIMTVLDQSAENTKRYREMFSAMSDDEFKKFIMSEREGFSFIVNNDEDSSPSLDRVSYVRCLLDDIKNGNKTTVFIGGSCSITSLTEDTKSCIKNMTDERYKIIIGDAPGVDTLVQTYLHEKGYDAVTIYYSKECRCNKGNWPAKKISTEGYENNWHEAKDIAMANDCTRGYMIWDGCSSATNANINRLNKQNKKCVIDYGLGGVYIREK